MGDTASWLRRFRGTTVWCASVFAAFVLAVSVDPPASADAQDERPRQLQMLERQVTSISEQVAQLSAAGARRDAELAEVKAKLDTTNSWLQIVGTAFAVLTLFGTGFSVYGWLKHEGRAEDAFTLALKGEQAAQDRSAQVHGTFLEGSRQTLDLVNATLTLAKDASERAASMIDRKARTIVQELDRDAKFLLESVPKDDDRALIASPATRSKLRTLAQRVAGFEINRFVLPEDIRLTPPATFIRGMEYHLNQQFDEAIRSWEEVALDERSGDPLKSLAWYWIGYERNNLGQFSEAEQSFDNALTVASGARRCELERILIETRFFNEDRHDPRGLVEPILNLLERVTKEGNKDEYASYRRKIAVTAGNMLSQAALSVAKQGRLDGAKELFTKAKDIYESVSLQDKWALFGLAQMLDALGEQERAEVCYRRVRQLAVDESVRREEFRTKVLARSTELICCLRVADLAPEAKAIRGLVEQELGRVDERLTVYSQMRKRNVTKRGFESDLEELMAAAVPLSR